jgi:superfamily II DNA helicase RecQ
MSGDSKAIAASSGFGTPINYLHVCLVCIYGIPNCTTANKAYQQLGRAGCDGNQAHIYFIPTPSDSYTHMDDFKTNLMNPAICPANTFAKHQGNLNWSCRNFLLELT